MVSLFSEGMNRRGFTWVVHPDYLDETLKTHGTVLPTDSRVKIDQPYSALCHDYLHLMEYYEQYDTSMKAKIEAELGLYSSRSHGVTLTKFKLNPAINLGANNA